MRDFSSFTLPIFCSNEIPLYFGTGFIENCHIGCVSNQPCNFCFSPWYIFFGKKRRKNCKQRGKKTVKCYKFRSELRYFWLFFEQSAKTYLNFAVNCDIFALYLRNCDIFALVLHKRKKVPKFCSELWYFWPKMAKNFRVNCEIWLQIWLQILQSTPKFPRKIVEWSFAQPIIPISGEMWRWRRLRKLCTRNILKFCHFDDIRKRGQIESESGSIAKISQVTAKFWHFRIKKFAVHSNFFGILSIFPLPIFSFPILAMLWLFRYFLKY